MRSNRRLWQNWKSSYVHNNGAMHNVAKLSTKVVRPQIILATDLPDPKVNQFSVSYLSCLKLNREVWVKLKS